MIVTTDELHQLQHTVAMADGGFDPLHAGHVAYLRAAHELGAPVLANLAPDDWISRKHPPLLPQTERAAIIDAIRWVDYTHLSHSRTVDVLETLQPRYYVKGTDWRGRLPDEELDTCAKHEIEIVYVDTVLNSSTAILEQYRRHLGGAKGR